MKTTLNEIRNNNPCPSGWETLLSNLGKTGADDEPIGLMCILKSNGIEDAVWCLGCFDYLDYCLFLADVAESVLHVYEAVHKDSAPRKAIQAIRDYKAGKITRCELSTHAYAAADAAVDASADVASAYAADAVADAAADAAVDADAAAYAYAVAVADAYAVADAAAAAAAAADAGATDAADAAGWSKTEQLFIKHFGPTNTTGEAS